MNLTSVFTAFFGWMYQAYDVLRTHTTFTAFGYESSYIDIVLAFIIISMVVSIFWKGAKA